MKKAYLPIFVALASGSLGPAAAAAVEITEQSAPIIYETKADISTPPERIAGQISQDYRNLRDEFSKHEFLERLKPTIERRVAEAAKAGEFSAVVGTLLGEYDFSRKAFPTGSGPQSFIPFGDYAVRFTNPEAAGFVPVPMEEAKKFATALKSSRRSTITYTGTLEKCAEETLNFGEYKVLYLKVSKIAIHLDGSGAEVASQVE